MEAHLTALGSSVLDSGARQNLEVMQNVESNGEPGGTRTRDHRIKSAMLYQLSYRPALDSNFRIASGPVWVCSIWSRSRQPLAHGFAKKWGTGLSALHELAAFESAPLGAAVCPTHSFTNPHARASDSR